MSKLLNNITSQIKENSVEENLFVKNIIVNKNKLIILIVYIFQLRSGLCSWGKD
jgi:hypothetical protein